MRLLAPAAVSNFESGDDITDWALLQRFEGLEPRRVLSLEILNELTDIEILEVTCAFRARDGKLGFEFLVGLPREPTSKEIQQIADALHRILDSAADQNIEWERPSEGWLRTRSRDDVALDLPQLIKRLEFARRYPRGGMS